MVAESGSGGKSDTPPGRILRPEPTTQWPHPIASFRARWCFYHRIPLKIAPCTKGLFPVQRSSEMMDCTPYRRRGFLHRMPQKTRRVHQEAVLRTECQSRTVGGRFWYRIFQTARKEKTIAKSAARKAGVTKIVFYLLASKFFRPKSTKSSKFICPVSVESSKSYRNLCTAREIDTENNF